MTRKTLFFVVALTAVAHAGTLGPPEGDEPGEYYRVRGLPDIPYTILPVKDEITHRALQAASEEKDRTVRAKALVALGAIADSQDTRLVSELTTDPVAEVRCEALKALARISKDSLERAAGERIRKDASPSVRRTAAILLGELKTGDAHLAAALDDADSSVRGMAVRSLGLIGGPTAVDNLPAAFKDPSPAVRAACAKALVDAEVAGAEDLLASSLSDSKEVVRGACAVALGRLGTAASSRLENVLKNTKETLYVLQCALNSLSRAGVADARPSIHRMLGHEDMGVRTAACNACGALPDPSSAEHLGKLIPDEQYQVRHAAASALIEIAGNPAEDVFRTAITHKLAIARREAAWGLGKLRDGEGLNLLCNALRDEDEDVRIISAWALGRLANTGGGEALNKAASDESAAVRTEVARSLALVDTPQGRSILVRMLNDKDAKVRARAARSIGELKHAVASALIKTLNDYKTSSYVREDAAWALGELKAKEAIPHLRRLLLEAVIPVLQSPPMYDSDATRIQTLKSLVQIGYEGLVKDLKGKLTDSEFTAGYWLKSAIAETLTKLTGTRYDFKRPGPSHRRWFIESVRRRRRNVSFDPDRKPEPIVFPAK